MKIHDPARDRLKQVTTILLSMLVAARNLGPARSPGIKSRRLTWLPPGSLTDLRPALIVNHMVEYSVPELDATFGALSDPTRRALLATLALGEATVSELALPHKISLAAISKHIQILERAGLVRRRRVGRAHHISLEASPLLDAFGWLATYQDFWDESLDSLVRLLEQRL